LRNEEGFEEDEEEGAAGRVAGAFCCCDCADGSGWADDSAGGCGRFLPREVGETGEAGLSITGKVRGTAQRRNHVSTTEVCSQSRQAGEVVYRRLRNESAFMFSHALVVPIPSIEALALEKVALTSR
jgi:hypothetical protein